MTARPILLAGVAACLIAGLHAGAACAEGNYLIVGNDEKTQNAPAGTSVRAPGNDSVSIIDITDPAQPRVAASLPLMNGVQGPPTNLQITPDGTLGLVANPVVMQQDGATWRPAPDNSLHVIDLTAQPPRLIETITVGRQPSGLAIARDGRFALVANRASRSISVLSIDGRSVRQIAEVSVEDEAGSVAITPDGRRAFITKHTVHRVGVLEIDGTAVTYDRSRDIATGIGVYTVEVTPDGRYALAANTGVQGDGHVDTVSVIDARANPPRVVDHVTVGDGPEGLVISPDGRFAVAVLLRGSVAPHAAWSYTRNGSVRLLRIGPDGVLKALNELPAGGLPEGGAFSPDSRFFYVANFLDRNLQVYRIDGDTLVDTGVLLPLPGQPAAIRGRP
ncbi:YncE family protein [Pseudoroseomonas wenyumeiae]|uniref:YncE family protein n=1 Tax=Teichococcus wenyumeiae TaxID=2478470 RepID=A0A3A9JLC1_9PROT|nr:YncE family protein [Pseudoroseomonas wenyumeiae]RKK05981.1 YncE family protein [Pseudoroseomonas wenyumeiae]RMI19797.1 YncE family protein [Pseudoroseomonas wenyumeiae]